MASTSRKVRAAAEGAVVGGAQSAAVIGALHYGMKGIAAVAPRAAAAIGVAASAPVMLSAAAAGGLYGGVKAARSGGHAKDIALGALGGAASMGTNIVVDAFTGTAKAEDSVKPRVYDAGPARAPKGGGENARDRSRGRNIQGRVGGEALKSQAELDRLAGEAPPTAPGTAVQPTAVAQPPQKGVVQKAKEYVLGTDGPKEDDALSKERRQLEQSAKETRRRMDIEFGGGGSGQKGVGPNYRKLQEELSKTEGRLGEITKQQAAKEEEEIATYRQMGALAAGAVIGAGLGMLTKNAATAAATTAGKGVEKLARTAVTAVNKAPKGVIAGTVQGDKASAAVTVARDAMSRRVIGAAEAYGLPAVNIGHGAGMYYMGNEREKQGKPGGQLMRMEGSAALAAGVFGLKYSIAAHAMRPKVSSDIAGKLQAAQNRLTREVRKGPAGVATARARALTSDANAKATMAHGRAQRATINTAARSEAAKTSSRVGVVKAGTKLEVTKVKGAAAVERAQITTKGSNSRAITRQNADIKYKDVWQDRRGRTYHRKDMTIRTRKGKAVANDNGAPASKRA